MEKKEEQNKEGWQKPSFRILKFSQTLKGVYAEFEGTYFGTPAGPGAS